MVVLGIARERLDLVAASSCTFCNFGPANGLDWNGKLGTKWDLGTVVIIAKECVFIGAFKPPVPNLATGMYVLVNSRVTVPEFMSSIVNVAELLCTHSSTPIPVKSFELDKWSDLVERSS